METMKDAIAFAAIEISSEPDIRRGYKKYIMEHGYIKTEPTEKGMKELDVFHPCYRTKRVWKKLSELQDSDLYLDIL